MPEPERDRAAVDDAHVEAVAGDVAGGQLGALHRRRQGAGERDDDDARSRRARRGGGRPARSGPVTGAAVDGSSGDAAQRAQNSAVVSCSRSTSSSSPKRMLSGTISMPHVPARSSGRSQELSVTTPMAVDAVGEGCASRVRDATGAGLLGRRYERGLGRVGRDGADVGPTGRSVDLADQRQAPAPARAGSARTTTTPARAWRRR